MQRYSVSNYFNALQRLIDNKPTVVPKGTAITNDAVSIEAGRKKGSIKKSRSEFKSLIVAICDAASKQKFDNVDPQVTEIERLKLEMKTIRKGLADSHEREASLVYEVFALRKKLSKLDGSKIFPIRGKRNDSRGNGDT